MECCKTLAGAVQAAFRSRSGALSVDLKSHPSGTNSNESVFRLCFRLRAMRVWAFEYAGRGCSGCIQVPFRCPASGPEIAPEWYK